MLGGVARAVVTSLAGFDSIGTFSDGVGTNAGFNAPWGVAVDANGNVYVADSLTRRIRKVTAVGGTRIGPVTLHAFFLCLAFRGAGVRWLWVVASMPASSISSLVFASCLLSWSALFPFACLLRQYCER